MGPEFGTFMFKIKQISLCPLKKIISLEPIVQSLSVISKFNTTLKEKAIGAD